MKGAVEFRVLGPLEVSDGVRCMTPGGPKQRALLTDLIIHASRVVSVERLIDDDPVFELPLRAAGARAPSASCLARASRTTAARIGPLIAPLSSGVRDTGMARPRAAEEERCRLRAATTHGGGSPWPAASCHACRPLSPSCYNVWHGKSPNLYYG
jgi:hypothetical protein